MTEMPETPGNTAEDPAEKWSIWGVRPNVPRPLWALLAISLIVALETFGEPAIQYPWYMSALVLATAIWLSSQAFRRRALFGIVGPLLGAAWLNPLLGGSWFSEQGVLFFLPHALFALYVAIASYTFMAREGATRE